MHLKRSDNRNLKQFSRKKSVYQIKVHTSFYNQVFVVTEFFNILVNDLNARKTARYNRLFVLTELVTNETQCK